MRDAASIASLDLSDIQTVLSSFVRKSPSCIIAQKSFLAYLLILRNRSPYYHNRQQGHTPAISPRDQKLTHLIKYERNWNERNREECQRRARPVDSQVLVHRRREQRKPSAKRASHEVVARQHASCVLRVRIGQIIEHAVE